jgi:hypothetical protein
VASQGTTEAPAGEDQQAEVTEDYEDPFVAVNDEIIGDVELMPVLPESWNPNMPAYWYPEKVSTIEDNRRSRLLTYRH